MAKSNIIALTFILLHLLSVVQGGRDTNTQTVLVATYPLCDCQNNPNVLEYKGAALVSGTADVYKHEYEISIDADQAERCEDLDPVKYVVISVDQGISNSECKSKMTCSAYEKAVNLDADCKYCGVDSGNGCSVSTGTDQATAGKGIKVKLPTDSSLYPFTFYVCMNAISEVEIGTLYYMPKTFTPAFMCTGPTIPRLCGNPSQPPTTPPSHPPTSPPSHPPTSPPSQPPTSPPSQPPTSPPSQPPTTPPSQPPSQPPTEPPSRPPTTPPTKSPSVFPTTSPISVPCDDFESGERLADYFVLSDMSAAGSYNARCDYYRNKAMSIGINNHFSVDKYYGKNKMTIGNVMEITFDLFVHSHCTNSNPDDCVIFRIGQHHNDTYPLIKITPSRAIQVILSLNGEQVTKTSANHVIHYNHAVRLYVKWTQETIQVTYDGTLVINAEIAPHPYETQSFYVDGSSTFKFEMYAGNVDFDCGDEQALTRVLFACHAEPDGATDSPQYVAEDLCQSNNTHLYTAQWPDVVDCAANRDLSDASGPVEVGPNGEAHPCCVSAEVADATITNLCVQTDWRPSWDKDYVTLCFMKQNFAAEAYTALKGTDQQQNSGDDGWMNVRSGYIEFDGNGATMLTALGDDINIYPVSVTDLLAEFTMIRDSDCGAGTDDVTDLCAGLEAAFDNFDAHRVTPESEGDPFRERKILILSNNRNLTCNDGGVSDICERFHDRIYGVGGEFPGVALVQTNVDMAGQVADNTYELCLTNNATANIMDVDSFGDLSYKDSVDDRDALIDKIQHVFCNIIPTPLPTRPPTAPPSQPPTSPPSQPPTSPPSQPPSQPPTSPPSRPPTTPPSQPPTSPPSQPPTSPPSQPPTEPPSQPPTSPPSQPPTEPPSSQPPTSPPSRPPTSPPTSPPSQPPTSPPSQPPSRPPTSPPSQPPTEPPSSQPPTTPPSQPPTSPPSQPPTEPPSQPPSRHFKPRGCVVNWYIDLILSVDVSCAMTIDECKRQQLLVADTFISLRPKTTRVINGVEFMQTRVSYIEMGSDSVVDILIDFPDMFNVVDRSVMSVEQQNDAYYDYIVSRGDVICTADALAARVGNPSLHKIAKNIGNLFDDSSDSQNDKEVAVFSNCGVANRTYTCKAYLDSRKAIIHNNPGDGINVQMANYVPQGDTSDSMGDPETYMACMVEYDTSGRIFVYNGTNDREVVTGLRDSICLRQPTPAPTSDPTMDPTRDPTTEVTEPPVSAVCGNDRYIDLVISVDVSCPMTRDECVQQQLLVADTFANLRVNSTRLINGVEWVQTRVSYIEMGSDSVVDILIDFPSERNEVDRSVMSIEQQNDAYYDYIVSRGDVICAADALAARVGNPSLLKIAKNIERLFDWSDNLNDKEVAVFSNCGVANRTYTCKAYLDSRRAIIHNNPGDGINIQMANYVPLAPNTLGAESMTEPETYMACMVEYDVDGRIFVYDGTNGADVVQGLTESICMVAPSPSPTADPTGDPTRDPVGGDAAVAPVENVNVGLGVGDSEGEGKDVYMLWEEYSLWIFAAIVSVFGLINVCICAYCGCIWGGNNRSKGRKYGFINNGAIKFDEDDTDCELDSDNDIENLVQYK